MVIKVVLYRRYKHLWHWWIWIDGDGDLWRRTDDDTATGTIAWLRSFLR